MKHFLFAFAASAILGMAQAQVPSYVPTDGLVGWYSFSGETSDGSSIGNNAILHGGTWVADRFGNSEAALYLDGQDDYVEIPHGDHLNFGETESFTLAFWWQPDEAITHSGFNGIVGKSFPSGSQPGRGWQVGRTGSTLKCETRGGYSFTNQFDNPYCGFEFPFSVGQIQSPTFVLLEFDREQMVIRMSLDGEVVSEEACATLDQPMDNDHPLLLGLEREQNFHSSGHFDDLGIWNRLLSVAEVNALSSGQPLSQIPDYVPTDGLVGWYPFNANASNEVNPAAGFVVEGPTSTFDRFGNPENAYSFDGIDDEIIATNPGVSGTGISLSFWYQSSQLESNAYLIAFGGTEWGSYFEVLNNHWSAQTSGPCYGPALSAGGTLISRGSDFFPDSSTWHHCAIVLPDGALSLNDVEFYLDGLLVNSTCSFANYGAPEPNVALSENILFGAGLQDQGAWSTRFQGAMDDVGFWSRALDPEEILGLFETNAMVAGCTDSLACNFNPEATEDDGSCVLVNSQQVVTACLGNSVSLDLGINTFGDVSEESGNQPMQTNIPVRLGTKNGQLAGYVLSNELGPPSWSSLVHVTQSPDFNEVGKWWMPQLEELGDTCWISAVDYNWSLDDKIQMIRFPIFSTLEINSAYSVDAWNGSAGGLMVLAAQEQVNINATLDMKGRGFRGFMHNSRVNSQDGVQGESWAGEGVSSFDPNESGGGGGDGGPPGCADGSGGGGGSSLAAGGIGYGDCGFPSNPGTPFANPTPSIVLGSAGGEGGADEDGGRPGGGGNGGGAVLILCNNIQGIGLIDVSGNNGGGACQGCFGGWGSGMGGGGGGAGGCIVTSATINASINLQGGGGGPNAPCGGCSTKYGGGGASGYSEEIEFNWSTQGLYIEWEDGQSGSVWQSPDFVSGDTIGYMISINDSEICQGEIMLLGISGCNDSLACNYASSDLCDNDCIYPLLDNDCEAGAVACAAGTVWDVESQMCVVATLPYLNEPGEIAELNPCYFDTNFNGLVDVTDLMNLLSVYSISCAWEE